MTGLVVALDVRTAEEAVRFVEEVGVPNVGILLDTYHMNIEEADLADAIHAAGEHLSLFHGADSNRQAVGRGHTDFLGVMRALKEIGYNGSIIVECTASGPDPFTPAKSSGWRDKVAGYVAESISLLRELEAGAQR